MGQDQKPFTLDVESSLEITDVSPFPPAKVGEAYEHFIQFTGGVGPYTFEIVGTIPPGLALNASTGKLYGTPTTEGPYAFNVKLTDSVG